MVLAFGAVASVQRFLAVGGDERFAFAGGVGGEIVTAGVRVLFLVWLARRLFAGSDLAWSQLGPRLERYLRGGVGVVLASASAIMLVALTVVAKVIPDAVGAAMTDASRSTYQSWELAIKNVTVIPFTMVWLTTIMRHALLAEAAAPAR